MIHPTVYTSDDIYKTYIWPKISILNNYFKFVMIYVISPTRFSAFRFRRKKWTIYSWKCIKFNTWVFVWQKLICHIWCIFKEKLFIFSSKTKRWKAKVLKCLHTVQRQSHFKHFDHWTLDLAEVFTVFLQVVCSELLFTQRFKTICIHTMNIQEERCNSITVPR